MTTTSRRPATTAVEGFLADAQRGSMSPLHYAADAVLDAVVPGWRLTAHGPEQIVAEYGRWFRHPAQFADVRRLQTTTGEVVEYILTWTEDGVGHTGRHVHVIDLDDTGAIVSDHVWCGGRWPAGLLAQMEQADDAQ